MNGSSSQSGRWLLVAVIAAVCSFGSMMAWLFLHLELVGSGRPWPAVAQLELFGQFFGMIFISGRIAARLLISRAAGQEVARSGRWRLIPLQFLTGVVLVGSGFVDRAQLWSKAQLMSAAVGVLLVLWAIHDAWRFWVRPRGQA